ncbi:hypothetical protein BC938DRAFT_479082 [Jimgerdemannia flammicorona]|uniref:Uncharacterized protein n=1 Tax=Jimgerdemannia flammicorona TaxID=994334 RepID=A0A433QY17_9FUNG|nr:hypothetical protein BC938DRAFT_479082 [Jimgerdemannia flammicorona]
MAWAHDLNLAGGMSIMPTSNLAIRPLQFIKLSVFRPHPTPPHPTPPHPTPPHPTPLGAPGAIGTVITALITYVSQHKEIVAGMAFCLSKPSTTWSRHPLCECQIRDFKTPPPFPNPANPRLIS